MSSTIRVRFESRELHKSHKLYKKYKRIGHNLYKNSIFISPTKTRVHLKEWDKLKLTEPCLTKFWIVTPKYELIYTSEDVMGIFLDEQETYVDRISIHLQLYDIHKISQNVLILNFKYCSMLETPCVEFRVVLTCEENEYVLSQAECSVHCEAIKEKVPDSWYSQPVTNWYLFF